VNVEPREDGRVLYLKPGVLAHPVIMAIVVFPVPAVPSTT
jgi:hypothetical protein